LTPILKHAVIRFVSTTHNDGADMNHTEWQAKQQARRVAAAVQLEAEVA
jgi:hypothetical protein